MEDFYKKYYFSIKKFVSQKIDDENVAEELVNDILMAAMNSLSNFNKKSSEFSWLCGIAKHKIIDYYRKKKLKTILFSAMPEFEEIADKALTPERDCLKNELKKEIEKTFEEIKEDYKKIIRLKYVDGFKISDIAKKLKLSIKATESMLIRAKSKFRQNWNYDKKTG
jgi:RNA polymerase sigma-70 factor, ECF subfamily